MKIAVTGAGGFLGTELLRQLSEVADIKIYAFSFDFERKRDTYVKADNIISVDNSEAAALDYSDIDILINCAFPRNTDDEAFAEGLNFIQKVIEKAVNDKVGPVINISSQSVYSQKRTAPADEDFPIVLESKYAVGKYWSELFVNTVCRNLRHTNLRMASLIGAGFNQRITNKFAAKVIAGEQITISGGEQIFGFLDVRDAAAAIIKIALSDCEWHEVYNLGTNNAYTLREIAECAVVVGNEIGFTAPEPVYNNFGEWQNSALDCSKFMKYFDWKPTYSMKDTMHQIYRTLM